MKIRKKLGFLICLLRGEKNRNTHEEEQLLEDFEVDLITQQAFLPEKNTILNLVLDDDIKTNEGTIRILLEPGALPILYVQKWCEDNPELIAKCSFHPHSNQLRIRR